MMSTTPEPRSKRVSWQERPKSLFVTCFSELIPLKKTRHRYHTLVESRSIDSIEDMIPPTPEEYEINVTKLRELRGMCSSDSPEEHYDFLYVRGSGEFGKVYAAQSRDSEKRKKVAIKRVNLQTSPIHAKLVDEINTMRSVSHKNIPRYINSFLPDPIHLSIVMELVSGKPLNKVVLYNKLSEGQLATVCRELCECLEYLHSKSILHRDLKSSNIMVTKKGKVKLIDFGMATKLAARNVCRERIGTVVYMALELIKTEEFDSKADIWSLGITVFELVKRRIPFDKDFADLDDFLDQLRNRPPKFHRWQASKQLRDFLAQCLIFSPAKRPSATELLKHNFLTRDPVCLASLSKP